MHLHSLRIKLILLLMVVITVAGCGGESPTSTPAPTNTRAPTATPAATATPAPTDTPAATPTPENVVSSLEDVKRATVRIEAQGSFVDPDVGLQLNVAGSGSGFIIDQSGLAVTNNHVVTGAALLQVYVGGDDRPRNAKILGVSECADLAVIDIDGDGFTYLEWYDGNVSPGLDVYAAGHPLGDPEFTLTRGIISKARADGETNWASVDDVVEHDANINPGNSGGPLVTADGKLVGVNYAGDSGFGQYFAIGRDQALRLIAQLSAGQDVDSIGVNGIAVSDGDQLYGIWVSSVESGSAADKAGVEGGDIIVKLEGLVLATDGTMADYCDVLRSHDADDTLAIEVLRFSSNEVLAGQLNGDPLELSFSFAEEFSDEVPDTETAGYSGYSFVSDDSGAIQIEIPFEWFDIDGSAWIMDDQVVGASLSASSSLNDFWNSFATPGVFFGASAILAESYDEVAFLDELADFSADCTYEGRFEYSDQVYTGLYDHYTGCGSVGSQIFNIVAVPEGGQFIIWVQTQIVNDADLEALDRIIDSFDVVGDLPSAAGSSTGGTGTWETPGGLAQFDGASFTIDYPADWEETSLDMFGLTMAIFARQQLSMEDLQSLDIEGLVSEDPFVLVMVVPQDMTSDFGLDDLDSAFNEFYGTVPEEDISVLEQGETAIGGASGRYVVATGSDPDLGDIGMRLVVANTADGTVIVFMGASPAQDLEANLAVFEHMHESFSFK